MSDVTDFNRPDDRRKARILWRMAGCPMGEEGLRIMEMSIEQTTPEQALAQLKHLCEQAEKKRGGKPGDPKTTRPWKPS